jgi:Uma2 family endonuclease
MTTTTAAAPSTRAWMKHQQKVFRAMHDEGPFDFAEFIDGNIILRAIPKGTDIPEGTTVIIDMPTKISHQLVQANLFGTLWNLITKHKLGVVLDTPTDLVINGQTFQPDVIFVATDNRSRIKEMKIDGYSKSTKRRDRHTKFRYYESAKIPTYWIVNPDEKEIEVYHLNGNRYDLDNIYSDTDTLLVSFKNDKVLKLQLKKIFA